MRIATPVAGDDVSIFEPPEFFENQILNTREAAEYLGVSKKTLLKYVRSGELPARRLGRSLRFLRSTLIDWAKGR
jgi:excisionase family DNA binding protein